MDREDASHIKVPVWFIQIVMAVVFAIMGWTVKESFKEIREDKAQTTKAIAEVNAHLQATDIRVMMLERK